MTHLTFEEISELADRAESRQPRAASHLAECAECSETLRRVGVLIEAARALPRDVAPPPEVWGEVWSRVAGRSGARHHASRWRYGGWMAAAAIIVIVVGMALLMPGRAGKAKASKMAQTTVPVSPTVVLAVESSYAATVAELRYALDARRSALSPSTIGVLERSLAAIDAAIAEARAALVSDPANQALVGILSANYGHKVELLKRATQLPPSS